VVHNVVAQGLWYYSSLDGCTVRQFSSRSSFGAAKRRVTQTMTLPFGKVMVYSGLNAVLN
jgi:hypothetical protein